MIIDIHVVVEAFDSKISSQRLDIYISCMIIIKEYKNERIPHVYCHQIQCIFPVSKHNFWEWCLGAIWKTVKMSWDEK